jgi:hypothetical protein
MNKERLDWYSIADNPEFNEGERYFAFSFDNSGVFGSGIWYYFWSNNVFQALTDLRKYYPSEKLNIRSAVQGEWDCDSFSISSHISH